VQAPLADLLRGGIPALAAPTAVIAAVPLLCRRPPLRRLSHPGPIRQTTTTEREGPGADRSGQRRARMRRFGGLIGAGPAERA